MTLVYPEKAVRKLTMETNVDQMLIRWRLGGESWNHQLK